jgi:transcriptional regulator with PAS, ATPase and Fis domain
VRIITKRALEKIAMAEEIAHLRQELSQCFGFENLIGKSPKMQEVFKIIRQTAESDSSVLITGESGTGKELVARAPTIIPRKHGRFVPVNCGAIARELIEAELFGSSKGLYRRDPGQDRFAELASGACSWTRSERRRRFSGEAPGHRKASSAGGPPPLEVNIRIVARTGTSKSHRRRQFRDDLFYRLNVISIKIPPLRQRREDIRSCLRISKYSKNV